MGRSKANSGNHVDRGAVASKKGVAAGERGNAAGRDNLIYTRAYYINKAVMAHKGMGNPDINWETEFLKLISVENLRAGLLEKPPEINLAKPISVHSCGNLYPCALLRSGWWEDPEKNNIPEPAWINGVQSWLFHGFHDWGPSWDFSWDFEGGRLIDRPYVLAQLGEGDEANSIPVVIPTEKALKLAEYFRDSGNRLGIGVGGIPVEINGVLCSRNHCPEAARLGIVGGILDYCIWLKEGEVKHNIVPRKGKIDSYSGYLWKCLAPAHLLDTGRPIELNQVYFVWEHTNFANQDAVKYNLDGLARKEQYISDELKAGKLVMLQKSSSLVPGKTRWSNDEFYDFYQQKDREI